MTEPDPPPPYPRRGPPEGGARLLRSTDGLLGGVASGIAGFVDARPGALRILFVALLVLTGGLFGLVYLLLWGLLPSE